MFQNIKVKTKILGIVGIMAFFMMILSVTGYYYTNKMSNGMKEMYSN
ncbi:MAG: hypothetical protein K0R55_2221, partial [Sporomusa sp.]|nr:hypothetical protein [Sporomusa sp.]